MRTRILLVSLPLLFLLFACGPRSNDAKQPSYAGFPSYAAEHPAQLDAASQEYTQGVTQAQEGVPLFQEFPNELSDPDWKLVGEIYDSADEAGRDPAFSDSVRDGKKVVDFMEEEKGQISRRVDSSIQKTAEKEGNIYDVEARGTIKWALGDSVAKQVEERIRESIPAHELVERHADSLGKSNASSLEEQVDIIAYTSYLVKVELPRVRDEMKHRASEGDKVADTLDDAIEKEQAFLDSSPGPKAKKSSSERLATLQQARQDVEPKVEAAKKQLKETEKELDELKKQYDKSFKALRKTVDDNAKAAEESAS